MTNAFSTQKLRMYIGGGNSKLGPRVQTFSLPSGVTCPGKTELCAYHCYMHHLEDFRQHLSVLAYHNLWASKQPEFEQDMLNSLTPGWLRLHVGGDFYSPEYAHAWYNILRARPDILMWTYTRSWTTPKRAVRRRFKRWLRKLNDLPNVQIILSYDETMDHPHNRGFSDFRTVYMSTDDNTEDVEADVVLRVGMRKHVKVLFGDSPVCPTENGLAKNGLMKKPTCTRCRWCFQDIARQSPMDIMALSRKFKTTQGTCQKLTTSK